MSTRGNTIVTDGLLVCLDKYNEQSYLGEPTVNLMTNPTFQNKTAGSNAAVGWGTGYSGTDNYYDDNPPEGDLYFGLQCTTPNVYQSHATITNLVASTTYTISYWVKTSTPHGALNNAMYVYGNVSGAKMAPVYASTTEWQKKSHVFTTFSTTQDYQINSYNYVHGMTVYISGIQIEEKSHATKFVNGTRSTTDGWQDLSGNGFHANLDADKITYSATNIPGTDRNNFSFSGTSYSGAFVGDSTGVGPYSADAMTIDAWVNLAVVPASQATSYPCIFSKRDVDTQRSYFFAFVKSSSVLYWEIKNSNGTYFIHSSTKTDWVADRWYHVAVTYHAQSGLSTMYIDGVEEAGSKSPSQPWTLNPIPSTTASTYVGRTHGGSYSFNGEIDIVKFYNRVLISTEVSQNFNAQKSRYGL